MLDNNTDLLSGGISIDVKGLREIRVCEDNLLGEEVFELVKGSLTGGGP